MEIQGKIKLIKPTQEVSVSFSKREFVIETNEQYAQVILLELQGNNTDIIDAYGIGQEVKCSINLRGRLWTSPQGEDKYFNTITCWKIQPVDQSSTSQYPKNSFADEPKTNNSSFAKEEHDDDLPF